MPAEARDDRRPHLRICMIAQADSVHTRHRIGILAARGHDVFVFDPRGVPLGPVESRVLRILGRVPKLRVLAEIRRAVAALRRSAADVVHVQFPRSAVAWTALLADPHPLVVSVWGGDVLLDEQSPPPESHRRLTLAVLDASDLITTESRFMTEAVCRLGDYRDRITQNNWGIDLELYRRVDASDLRDRLAIPASAPVLYCPKLLQPFYNTHLIVEALGTIRKTHPDARLVLGTYAADPDYARSLERLARETGVADALVFLPFVPTEEVPRYYSMADLVIAIPPSDGVPRSMFEAMACEVPGIMGRLPTYAEFVTHGENGYLVDISADAVARAVLDLLGDAALRERIVGNGLRTVHDLADCRVEAERMEREYERLLRGAPRRLPLARRAMLLLTLLQALAGR